MSESGNGQQKGHPVAVVSTSRVARRTVLGGMFALAAAGCAGPGSLGQTTPRPLGLASITVARELADDYPATLRRVEALGYSHFGFPLAAMSPRQPPVRDASEVAAMARDAGLEVGVVRLGHAERPQAQMQLASRIGAQIVAQSASPVFFTGPQMGVATREEFDAWLPQLAELAAVARAEGLRFVYHNHVWDHVAIGGLTPLEIIAQRFAPGEVDFEIDLAWARLGGVDPLALVRSLGARVLSLHYKDVDPQRGPDHHMQLVAPGEGSLDFANLIPDLDRTTNAVGYVEVDQPQDGLMSAQEGVRTIQQARGLI